MSERKRINSLIEKNRHRRFKQACADDEKSMTVVLEMLIDAYLKRKANRGSK